MKEPFELNKVLFEAVAACNYEEAERLLNLGADPLGSTDETDADEHLLGELFCEMQDNEALETAFPKFLELFYAHGMDIASRGLPTDDGDNIHPLWMLAFCQTESGLNVLHTMLEHGLDRDSAEVLVDHILMDMEMCDGCEIEDAWWMERTICGLKMLMLTASYPNLLNQSTYIQSCIALEKNDAQMLPQFRNWNNFDYHIDLSTCTNIPHGLRDATLTIRNPKSKKTVWTLSI
ncbi:MAG TPA: hypothetical protein DEW37_07805 [Oscillibacter sp.]|jgi:hypothetical protein|nr:hypothetical protein [Oscillibacter sp.]